MPNRDLNIYSFVAVPQGKLEDVPMRVFNICSKNADDAIALLQLNITGKSLRLCGFEPARVFIGNFGIDLDLKTKPKVGPKTKIKPVKKTLLPDYEKSSTKQIDYLLKYLKSKGYKIKKPYDEGDNVKKKTK